MQFILNNIRLSTLTISPHHHLTIIQRLTSHRPTIVNPPRPHKTIDRVTVYYQSPANISVFLSIHVCVPTNVKNLHINWLQLSLSSFELSSHRKSPIFRVAQRRLKQLGRSASKSQSLTPHHMGCSNVVFIFVDHHKL